MVPELGMLGGCGTSAEDRHSPYAIYLQASDACETEIEIDDSESDRGGKMGHGGKLRVVEKGTRIELHVRLSPPHDDYRIIRGGMV